MFSEFSQMKIQLDSKKLKRKMLKNFIENYLKKIAKQVKSKAAILYISSTQQSRNSIKWSNKPTTSWRFELLCSN